MSNPISTPTTSPTTVEIGEYQPGLLRYLWVMHPGMFGWVSLDGATRVEVFSGKLTPEDLSALSRGEQPTARRVS